VGARIAARSAQTIRRRALFDWRLCKNMQKNY
jgi:hypothetical protein